MNFLERRNYAVYDEAIDKILVILPDEKLTKEVEQKLNDEIFESLSAAYYKKHKIRLIEPEIKKLIRSKKVRYEMLKVCGKKAFLYPDAPDYPKFPVMAPIIENGKIVGCRPHCGLVVAAWYRARQWEGKHPEYKKIEEKALELYKKWNCDKKVPIHLHVETIIFEPKTSEYILESETPCSGIPDDIKELIAKRVDEKFKDAGVWEKLGMIWSLCDAYKEGKLKKEDLMKESVQNKSFYGVLRFPTLDAALEYINIQKQNG